MARAHTVLCKEEKPQAFQGRLVDRAVQVKKLEKQQDERPKVTCEEQQLINVFRFHYKCIWVRYLQRMHLKRLTWTRGSPWLWRDAGGSEPFLTRKLSRWSWNWGCMKRRCVHSWHMDARLGLSMKKLVRGSMGQTAMLARITGKSIPQEARSASTSLDIIKK